MKKAFLILLVFLLGVLVCTSYAVEVTLLGPKQYLRTQGAPDVYTDTFPGRLGQGALFVKNGEASGENRVSSAIVSINGEKILGTNNFNQNVYEIIELINLEEDNTITVDLRSSPGSYLTITILQEIEAEAAMVIGPEGGIIEVTESSSSYYGVKLEVPVGALNEDTMLSIDYPSFYPPVPEGFTAGDNPIELQPTGLIFNELVKLITPSNGLSERNFYFYDEIEGLWSLLGTIFNPDTDNFEVDIVHFSLVNSMCRSENFAENCRTFNLFETITYKIDATTTNAFPYTEEEINEAIEAAVSEWIEALDWKLHLRPWDENDVEEPGIKFYWDKKFIGINLQWPFIHTETLGACGIDENGYIYIHFNDTGKYRWTANDYEHDMGKKIISITTVALHEMGHALGLAHHCTEDGNECCACENDAPAMAPYLCVNNCSLLLADDKRRIRRLYGLEEDPGPLPFEEDWNDGVIDTNDWVFVDNVVPSHGGHKASVVNGELFINAYNDWTCGSGIILKHGYGYDTKLTVKFRIHRVRIHNQFQTIIHFSDSAELDANGYGIGNTLFSLGAGNDHIRDLFVWDKDHNKHSLGYYFPDQDYILEIVFTDSETRISANGYTVTLPESYSKYHIHFGGHVEDSYFDDLSIERH